MLDETRYLLIQHPETSIQHRLLGRGRVNGYHLMSAIDRLKPNVLLNANKNGGFDRHLGHSRVQGSGFKGSGFRVQGLRFKGSKVQGSGFKV